MDEFADFQMAIGGPKSSLADVKKDKMEKGLRLTLGQSPVHRNNSFLPLNNSLESRNKMMGRTSSSTSNHVSIFPNLPLPVVISSPAVIASGNGKTGVGSRLANYNLGLGPQQSGEVQGTTNLKSNFSNSSACRTLTIGSSPTDGSSSLIGEEDKYAALRDLVDFSMETNTAPSSFLQAPFVNSNCDQSVTTVEEPDPGLDFGDFGDFQSFSGVRNQSEDKVIKSQAQPAATGSKTETTSGLADFNTTKILVKGIRPPPPQDVNLEFGDFISVHPTSSIPVTEEKKNSFFELESILLNSHVSHFEDPCGDGKKFNLPNNGSSDLSNNNLHSGYNGLNETAKDNIHNATESGMSNSSPENMKENFGSNSPFYHRPPYMKTSLIGYDGEVSNIDFAKCASFDDSISIDQDFPIFSPPDHREPVIVDKYQSFNISPETRSIASLDLGNYCVSPDDSAKHNYDPPQKLESTVTNFTSMSSSNNYVPHGIILDEVDAQSETLNTINHSSTKRQSCSAADSKLYSDAEDVNFKKHSMDTKVWIRCLESCIKIISNAIKIFNSSPNGNVTEEVIREERGRDYIENLVEVYLVFKRIQDSIIARQGGVQNMENICQDVDSLWLTLTKFFHGTPVMDIFVAAANLKELDDSSSERLCPVCMQPVNPYIPNSSITQEGHFYHCPCANLWIHTVSSTLPSLPLTVSSLSGNTRNSNFVRQQT